MTPLVTCEACGAAMADEQKHAAWHQEAAGTVASIRRAIYHEVQVDPRERRADPPGD